MLDFESYSGKFPIIRTTCVTNPAMCDDFGVDEFISEPISFIVTNSKDLVKRIDKFQDKIDLLNRHVVYNTGRFKISIDCQEINTH
jgi:hypothetical protein